MNVVPNLLFRGPAASNPQVAATVLMGADLTEAASNLGLVQTALQLRGESDDQLLVLTATIDRFLAAVSADDSESAERYRALVAGQIRSLSSVRWQKAFPSTSLYGDRGEVVARLTHRLRKDWSQMEPVHEVLPFPATPTDARGWLVRGNSQRDRGNFASAAEWYSKAGWAFSLQDAFGEAISAYEDSVRFYRRAEKYSSAGRMMVKIADLYLAQLHFAEAIVYYDRGAALLAEGKANPDKTDKVIEKKVMVIHEALRSNSLEETLRKHIRLFQKVALLHEAAGDTVLEGLARLTLADGLLQLRQYEEADGYYTQGLGLFSGEKEFLMAGDAFERRGVGFAADDFDRGAVARIYNRAGLAYLNAGETAKGAKMFEEAAKLFYQNKDYLLSAESWRWAMEHYQSSGHHRAALSAKRQRAYALEKGGSASEALLLFQEIAEEARELGDKEEEATADFSLGFILLDEGKNAESAEAFDRAYRSRLAQGYDGSAGVYAGLKSIALRGAGKRKEANRSWEVAKALMKNNETQLLLAIGNVYEAWGHHDAALSVYARGLEVTRHRDYRSKAMAQENIGRVLIKRGELKKAQMFYRRARNFYSRSRMPEDVERINKAIGEIRVIQ